MLPLSREELEKFLDNIFHEDIRAGDITTNTVIPENVKLKVQMVAREDMFLAGLPLAAECFIKLDPKAKINFGNSDGNPAKSGEVLLTVSGKARALLTAERVALNLVQHLSGIATYTNEYVKEIEGTNATLLDTRKTTPGLRVLEKYATNMGGAENHRMGLFDAVMIKDNHIAIGGGISETIKKAKAKALKNIEVECDTIGQVIEALSAGADRLLLDNMSIGDLKKAISLNKGKIPLEASGGVTLDTILAIAKTGVEYISVGCITQSAPAVDIGLDFLS